MRGELVASEARFRSLVETAAAPILLLSPDLIIRELNAEAEMLYGCRRDDVLGAGYFPALDPEGRGGVSPDDFSRVLDGQPIRSAEGFVRRPDGTERVLLWNASRLFDPKHGAIGIIAVAQDITERQQAEEALREREARLSSIIETAPDAIVTIDERGMVQSFSTAAEHLFGYQAGEVIGQNIGMLMPSPYRESHDGYVGRYLSTGERRIIGIGRQVEAQRKDGSIFPVELAVGEAKFAHTRIFTGFIRDISARARLEDELRQAHKMEAIGQLTGGLAHDFNNLLTVISGNLEMLDARIGDAMQREMLGEAQEATELGAKLAGRLLAFGRRQPLHPKPIDLSDLVAGLSDLLRRSLGETVRLETRLSPAIPATLADPGQVENALLNLAINARDAMPKGGHLVIETKAVTIAPTEAMAFPGAQPGEYVMLAVTDSGIGMTPEVRQKAFDPFFTTKGPGQGTGLGLSMVYGFVKQSGGHVRLFSEIGKGTVVQILLPAVSAPAAAAVPGADRSGNAKGERILVVEDDARVRRVSLRRLRQLGYEVLEANDAHAALELVAAGQKFDLLFTDVVMPGMTGIELAHEVRKQRPHVKVLFTSGYAEPAMSQGAQRTERSAWLSKPYTSAELGQKLRQLFGS